MKWLLCFALATLAGCGGGNRPESETQARQAPQAAPVRITQFYAATPAVPKGETSLLCYGVEGAVSVRLEPPVQEIKPTLTRCFDVKPAETTTYKLIATGANGETATQSATVQVGGARPRLFDLAINKQQVKAGEEVQFCFQSSGATTLRGSPGKFLRGGKPERDCLMDTPSKTTSYKITVANAQGLSDTASITVEVIP